VATSDDVTIREVEIRVGRNCVEICPAVPPVETEQASMVHWGGASMEEVSCKAVIECVQEGGRRSTDLMGDCVRRHSGERRVEGLGRVQDRVAVTKGAPQTHRRRDRALHGNWREQTDNGKTGKETGVPQEGHHALLLLREGGCMQRSCTLGLHGIAVSLNPVVLRPKSPSREGSRSCSCV
jgi:hypothetical protein